MHSILYKSAIGTDILFSSIFATFYNAEHQWSNKYSIFSSGIDLTILAVLRSMVLLVLIMDTSNFWQKPRVLWTIALFSYSFTLIKLLCLAEDMELLSRPGVILSLIWSLAATATTGYAIYRFGISKKKQSAKKEYSGEISDSDDSDDEDAMEDDSAKEKENASNVEECENVTAYEQIMFILGYCKDEWIWYMAGFLLMFIQVPADVLEPSAKGNVIDVAVGRKGYSALLMALLYQFGTGIISNIFGGLSSNCLHNATSTVGRKMKLDLFKSLVLKDIAFFDANPTAELVSKLEDDCDTASSAVSDNVTNFIQNFVVTFFSLGFVLFYSWRMTVLACVTFPIMFIITEVYGEFNYKQFRISRHMAAKAKRIAFDVLSTMRTVRSFGCERREIRRYTENLDKVLQCERRSSLSSAGYSWTIDIAQNLTDAVLLLYGGHLVFADKMSSAVLVAYFLYLERLNSNVYGIMYTTTQVMNSINASKQVFIYMKNVSEHQMKGDEKPEISGRIELTAVNFSYPSRPTKEVLKEISLTIESGKTTAFVGISGGGKSTIVSLIEQFYSPCSGSITLDGTLIEKIEHEYYHEKISLVAQEPVLYDCSIRENILYGYELATDEDVVTAAKMANAHDFIMQLEKGYNTHCGERGIQLSGGQKQRIAIARALVRKPRVLILDEATSALDAHAEDAIQEALKRISGKLTIIIVAHRLSTVKGADRIYVIDDGIVVESGTHAEMLRNVNGPYFSLVAKQRTNT